MQREPKNTLLHYNAMPADQYASRRPIRAGCRETATRIPQRNLGFFLTNILFRISNENRRTLRCKTRSGRVLTENRIFGKKPQKSRPKKKRGKNLTKTTETEDHFVDNKTLVALDKTLIRKTLYIWGLTCQHAGVTKNTLLRHNARPGGIL